MVQESGKQGRAIQIREAQERRGHDTEPAHVAPSASGERAGRAAFRTVAEMTSIRHPERDRATPKTPPAR